ncbi:MAG TPA: DUF3604 domain-containing protein, partial [Armatimonadota bacterium]|nr:DUF3604 domain-containing protein [Armatimonadota bacterium]
MNEISRLHGTASLTPTGVVTAGSFGTWTIHYTAGALGVDENASLKVIWRFASDWGKPQFDALDAPNYATVTTSANARIEAAYQPKGYIRPWGRCLQVDIRDGSLAPGDTLTITLGDTSQGSPGSQAQTFLQRGFRLRALVDAHGTWQYVELPEQLALDVVPGPAEQLVVIAPSQATVGEPVRVVVRAEDRWGNPATGFEGDVALGGLPGAETVRLSAGIGECDARFAQPGCHRLTAGADGFEPAGSNPVLVTQERPSQQFLWGDLHGQSAPTIGTGTIEEYFEFARGYGALDFTSHQGNDFQITREQWAETKRCVREFTEG